MVPFVVLPSLKRDIAFVMLRLLDSELVMHMVDFIELPFLKF